MFDGRTHLLRRRRGVGPDTLTSDGGREQSREEMQVFGPDVNGEPRPQVVQFLEHPARAAAVELPPQVTEQGIDRGVVVY